MLQWAAADVPQLAEVMKKVEESDSLVKIGWTPIASGTGSVVIGDDRFGRQSVYMDSTLLDDDIRIVAHNLAHELYHAAEGRQADSIQEEMEAYRMQYDVAAKLCLPLKNTGLEQIHRLDPSAPKGLEAGESILRAWGAVYPWIPMYPIPVSDPFFESFQFASYYVYYDLNGQRKP